MGTAPDQSILEALRGNAVENLKHPTPRLVKVYISSSKKGKFAEQNDGVVCTNAFIQFAFNHSVMSFRIQRRAQSVIGSHRT